MGKESQIFWKKYLLSTKFVEFYQQGARLNHKEASSILNFARPNIELKILTLFDDPEAKSFNLFIQKVTHEFKNEVFQYAHLCLLNS